MKASQTFKQGKAFDLGLLRRVYALAKPYQSKVYIAIFLTVLASFLGPIRPYLIQYTVDRYISVNDAKGLMLMCLLLGGILILQSGIQVWSTVLTNYLGQNVIKDLRLKIFDYLTGLKLLFYDKTPVGTLVTRTVSDIETIADVFSEGLINISGDILQIIFILIMMFGTDWKLSLVSLSVLPLLLYASYVFKEKVRISFEDVRNQVARLNTFVQEHIQGMQIVQLFNREKTEYDRFKIINATHRDANIRGVMYYSVFFPVVELIAAISTALIVWYGAKAVMNHDISIGAMIAFIMYINMFFRPIRQLADRFNTLQMGMVAANRIFDLLDEEMHIQPTGNKAVPHIKGEIEFKDVWFAYKEGFDVLKDVSFHVSQGKTLALVGATGAGKSSVINLISRFYEINKGEILIDNTKLQELNIHDLRKHISVVMQDVFLFSGSVMDNIRLHHPEISEEKVIETAKMLGAHDFIIQLPQGYNQNVYERGATLSVGQRQLISFVRAMVTNPAVLILDEATSSVDHETEETIQHAIKQMMKGRTSIVIAHRLSTIQHADEILVLDKGKIAEQGTHESLLKQNGLYHQLYQMQFAETIT
jgi:ATP-binding cassette subfamily B multidrug efflux pump